MHSHIVRTACFRLSTFQCTFCVCVCVHSFALEDYLTAHSIPCYGLDGDNIRTGECLAAISRVCVYVPCPATYTPLVQMYIIMVGAIITFVVVLLYNIVALYGQANSSMASNAFFA